MKNHKARRLAVFYLFAARHKIGVWAIAAIVFTLALLIASTARLDEDPFKLLPSNDPALGRYRQARDVFGLMDQLLVAIGPAGDKPVAADKLAAAADALAEKLDGSAFFANVFHKTPFSALVKTLDVVRAHRVDLTETEDLRAFASTLTPTAVQSKLAKLKRDLTTFPSPLVAAYLRGDPLGFDAPTLKRLGELAGDDFKDLSGRLFSRDGRYALLTADARSPFSDGPSAERVVRFMNETVAAVQAKYPDVRVHWFSGHRYAERNAGTLKRGAAMTTALAVLLVLALSVMAYRRPTMVPLTLLPTAFGAAIGSAAVALFFRDVSSIALGCGSILVGISVDYGVHVLYRLDRERSQPDGAFRAFAIAELTPPVLVAVGATATAFLVLLASTLPGYRQLGVFATAGALAAATFGLIVLPTLVSAGRERSFRPSPVRDWVPKQLPRFIDAVRANRRRVLWLVAGLCLLAVPGALRVRFQSDIQKINASSPAIDVDKTVTFAAFGDPLLQTVIAVEGETPEDAARQNETLYAVLERSRTRGAVQSVSSTAPLLPSRKTMEARRAAWRAFWTPERLKTTRATLIDAARETGWNAEVLTGFVDAVARAADAPFVRPEDYDGAIPAYPIRETMKTRDGKTFFLTRVVPTRAENFAEIAAAARGAVPGAWIHNGPVFAERLLAALHSEILRMSVLSFAVVMAVLAICFRGDRYRTVAGITPLLIGTLWTLGAMGYAGVEFNFMNCLIGVFAFGLTVDYCAFLIDAMDGPSERFGTVGGAVVVSSLTSVCGLGALAFGGHPALFSLGVTAAAAVTFGTIAALSITPAFFAPKPRS